MVKSKEAIEELYKRVYQSLTAFVMAFLIDKPLDPAKFHTWLGKMLLNKTDNIAIEGFRESAKTTYVVYGYLLYALTFPRKERSYIVLIKASDDLAKSKMREIRDIYLQNKLMSHNVQKIYQQGECLDFLTKEGVRMRIEAYGKGVNIRGLVWNSRRPDIVVMDDVQTLDDVNSQMMSERDWGWFLSDVYMMSKSSRIFMIGNNLGERCIIERLGKNAKDFGFKFFRIPAIKDGKSMWPAKFTMRELEAERRAYEKAGKIDVWMRERMCVAVSEQTQVFSRKYFRYYTTLPKALYNYYTAVDLAVSTKQTADYSVVLTIAVNSENQRFIVDITYGRMKNDEVIEAIFKHVVKYKPVHVCVEGVAFQKVMEQILHKEMLRRNVFFTLKMISSKGKKEDRIKSLQPLYAAGAVWHRLKADWLDELETELTMFTEMGARSEHDDLIDALEMANREATAPISLHRKQRKARAI